MLESHNGAADLHSDYSREIEKALEFEKSQEQVQERFMKMSKTLSEFHKKISSDITNLVAEETKKLAKITKNAEDPSIAEYSQVLKVISELGNQYFAFSIDAGEKIGQVLKENEQSCKAEMAKIDAESRFATQAFGRLASRLDSTYNKTVRKGKAIAEKLEISMRRGSDAGQKHINKSKKDIKKAMELVDLHTGDLETFNSTFVDIRDKNIGTLCHNLGARINRNDNVFRLVFKSMEASLTQLSQKTQELAQDVKRGNKCTCNEVVKFSRIREMLEFENAAVFRFGLPFTSKDIQVKLKQMMFKFGSSKATNMLLEESDEDKEADEGPEVRIFDKTFEETIAFEKERLGSDGEESLLTKSLLERLVELDGHHTEGIFRVSPSFTDLAALQEQVNRLDYDFSSVSSPFTVAELFKRWLVQLVEPLIPQSLYALACQIGKEYGKLESSAGEKITTELLPALTPQKQIVLKRIAGICKLIASEDCHKSTKMDIGNLAIVFSPSFVRYEGKDMAGAFGAIDTENSFSECLLKTLIATDYYISYE